MLLRRNDFRDVAILGFRYVNGFLTSFGKWLRSAPATMEAVGPGLLAFVGSAQSERYQAQNRGDHAQDIRHRNEDPFHHPDGPARHRRHHRGRGVPPARGDLRRADGQDQARRRSGLWHPRALRGRGAGRPPHARGRPEGGCRSDQGAALRRPGIFLDQRHASAHGDASDQAGAQRRRPDAEQGSHGASPVRRLRREGEGERRGVRALSVAEAGSAGARRQDLLRQGLQAVGMDPRLGRLHG